MDRSKDNVVVEDERTGPMTGVRVVELGAWVAGPAAAGILGDWGAEVIKVEPLTGDPFRGYYVPLTGQSENPPFELDNRGKRSVAINLVEESGREVVTALIDTADVFVTNLRGKALEGWHLDYEHLSSRNQRLVYAHVTGYGQTGPDSDRASYDVGAFWSRTGVASLLSPVDGPPTSQRGGMGDHTTALATAAGVSAALFARQTTGTGQLVATSLLRSGLYFIGWDISERLRWGDTSVRAMPERRQFPNPLFMSYQDSQGKWMWLLGLEPDRHWKKLARAVGRDDWADDPELETMAGRARCSNEIIDYLDEKFGQKTRDEWHEIFAQHDVWRSPVLTPFEATLDPAIDAAGAFIESTGMDGQDIKALATPVEFSSAPSGRSVRARQLGEDTENVLLELGYSWEEIGHLKDSKVIL
jgi:crotonobetainyl-CoA:carnitine CoA-transferase CaiB-like acyl-CoA transferase